MPAQHRRPVCGCQTAELSAVRVGMILRQTQLRPACSRTSPAAPPCHSRADTNCKTDKQRRAEVPCTMQRGGHNTSTRPRTHHTRTLIMRSSEDGGAPDTEARRPGLWSEEEQASRIPCAPSDASDRNVSMVVAPDERCTENTKQVGGVVYRCCPTIVVRGWTSHHHDYREPRGTAQAGACS